MKLLKPTMIEVTRVSSMCVFKAFLYVPYQFLFLSQNDTYECMVKNVFHYNNHVHCSVIGVNPNCPTVQQLQICK